MRLGYFSLGFKSGLLPRDTGAGFCGVGLSSTQRENAYSFVYRTEVV